VAEPDAVESGRTTIRYRPPWVEEAMTASLDDMSDLRTLLSKALPAHFNNTPVAPKTRNSLDDLLERAERLAAGPDRQAEAAAWGDLAAAALELYGPVSSAANSAASRKARALLDYGDPNPDPDAREAAERAAVWLGAALGDDSVEALYAKETAARLRLKAGDAEGAGERLREVARNAVLAESLGPRHPLTLSARRGAALADAENSGRLGRLPTGEPAETAMLEAFADTEEALGRYHPESLEALDELGRVRSLLGDRAAARDCFRAVMERRAWALGSGHPDTLLSAQRLAGELVSQERAREARELSGRVLAGREALPGRALPLSLSTVRRTAPSTAEPSRPGGRDPTGETAMPEEDADAEIATGRYGPETLAALDELGRAWSRLGRHAAARDSFRAAMERRAWALGSRHPDTLASARNTLASARNLEGELLAISVASGAPEPPAPALAGIVSLTGNSALAGREALVGPSLTALLSSLEGLGETCLSSADYASALGLYSRAKGVREAVLGPGAAGGQATEDGLAAARAGLKLLQDEVGGPAGISTPPNAGKNHDDEGGAYRIDGTDDADDVYRIDGTDDADV
jgi:hypothetical protein